ncbi:MAG: lipid-binding SYLF domain-containing protein [Proteobacteria bacterium]|nr:lipid-binding SYLF domain-containing protein [Pseudomonadota bacterium]
MSRTLCALVSGLGILALGLSGPARASETQQTVDLAKATLEEILTDPDFSHVHDFLKRARAVVVIPRVFKAGFIVGGAGGTGVLLARDGAGGWSGPAFVTLAAGSVGLQAGVQDSRLLLVIMNDRALNALLTRDFKLGADASVAIGPIGAGIEASTTANLNMDVFSFSKARGFFGGGSVEGAAIIKRNDLNKEYYGVEVSAPEVVLAQKATNPAAEPLRALLARR